MRLRSSVIKGIFMKTFFMKRWLFVLAFCACTSLAFSQTKRIAHRSHSGSDATFSLLTAEGNFGLPPSSSDTAKKKIPSRPIKVPKDTIPARDTFPAEPDTLQHLRASLAVTYIRLKEFIDL